MIVWQRNVADQVATVFAYQDDGVTPVAAADVALVLAQLQIRWAGGGYSAAAGTLSAVTDGEFEYIATAAETNHDGMITLYLYEAGVYAPSRTYVNAGWIRNVGDQIMTILACEDDGVTPVSTADAALVLAQLKIRPGGSLYIATMGTLVGVIDGEFDYAATQAEANHVDVTLFLFDAGVYAPFRAHVDIVAPTPPPGPTPTPTPPRPVPVPSPLAASSPDYVDQVKIGLSRLVQQFQFSGDE